MKVAICQLDLHWEDPELNYKKVRRLLEHRRDLHDSLIVLPEMFSTGFSMNVPAVTAEEPARTESMVRELASTTRGCVLAGLGVPGADGYGKNIAIAINPEGEKLAEYTKIHPFTFGGETKHYERGDSISLFSWQGFQVCPFICYDLRFPEIFRGGVKKGAEVYCVIANWPDRREFHWVNQLQARAIENQAYVIGVNRCGSDPALNYSGRSMVVDPHGKIVADAGNGECVVVVDLDPEVVRGWRREFPLLGDMHYPS
jgi:omega-amidase